MKWSKGPAFHLNLLKGCDKVLMPEVVSQMFMQVQSSFVCNIWLMVPSSNWQAQTANMSDVMMEIGKKGFEAAGTHTN